MNRRLPGIHLILDPDLIRSERTLGHMNEAISQSWYDLYSVAIFELNPKKLVKLADATDQAIQSRLRDLQYDSDHHEERRIMGNAQRTLAFLRDNAREHEKH